jgi:hypothetical protein
MMFCLGATVGDPCKMCHLVAKSADSMLLNLPHSINQFPSTTYIGNFKGGSSIYK